MSESTIREEAVTFPCEGDLLVGVIAVPVASEPRTGVVVVVGGPQYRIGSHRQFVHLSRRLAADGLACMRFDYRGMGDSEGALRSFDSVNADIRAAVDAFSQNVPTLQRIVLWGLCDGASAVCLYASTDPRIAGIVLANPWVRTDTTKAETYLRHYYLRRLIEASFWKKLLSGRFHATASASAFLELLRTYLSRGRSVVESSGDGKAFWKLPFPGNMAGGLACFAKDVLIVLCGNDYTAAEFRDVAKSVPEWDAALRKNRVTWLAIKDADHTFSTEEWRTQVATMTTDWVKAEVS